MSDVTILSLSELPEWKPRTIRKCGTPANWGYGRGGYGLPDDQWHVHYVDQDLHQTIYLIPTQLNPLIKWQVEQAREDFQRQLRALAGL